jgi:hypothetical protein
MRNLPDAIIHVLRYFELVFSERIWEWAKVLLVGAILAPGTRTVTAALRVMGLSNEAQFQNYHRVLNRATWSCYALSRILLPLLLRAFVPAGTPVVIGLDDHIERRRGEKIAAKGIYRDAVRSSKAFFVKTSGLRWVSMMLLAPIPWAKRDSFMRFGDDNPDPEHSIGSAWKWYRRHPTAPSENNSSTTGAVVGLGEQGMLDAEAARREATISLGRLWPRLEARFHTQADGDSEAWCAFEARLRHEWERLFGLLRVGNDSCVIGP